MAGAADRSRSPATFGDPPGNSPARRIIAWRIAYGVFGAYPPEPRLRTFQPELTSRDERRAALLVFKVLIGADAYRVRAKARLYFGTHGLVAGEIKGLAEPSLALTLPKHSSDTDDGLLTASEVAQLKLNAEWVILSACNTITGEKPGAEALSGLARAFFYAGARALFALACGLECRHAADQLDVRGDEVRSHARPRQSGRTGVQLCLHCRGRNLVLLQYEQIATAMAGDVLMVTRGIVSTMPFVVAPFLNLTCTNPKLPSR